MSEEKKQNEFGFEPEYLEDKGAKYAFTGLLYTPAPGESEKLEHELRVAEQVSDARQHAAIWESLTRVKYKFTTSVKVRPMEALKFRAKGQ